MLPVHPVAVAATAVASVLSLLLHGAAGSSRRRKCAAATSFTHSISDETRARQVEVVLLPLASTAAEAVLAADSSLGSAHVIGLDCEWQPERSKHMHSPVSLLQLSAGDRCYLAQLLHMDDVPSQLRYLLENPLVVKVGVTIREDVRRLQRDYDIRVASAVDLVDVISAVWPSWLAGGASLAAMSKTVLGLQVDKSLQCSDWASAELTKPQLTYAALDAWLSLQIAQQLQPLLASTKQQQVQDTQVQEISAAASNGSWADVCIKLLPYAAKQTRQSVAQDRPYMHTDGPQRHHQQQQQQQQQNRVLSLHGPRLPQRLPQGSSRAPALLQQWQRQAVTVVLRLQFQLPTLQDQQQRVLLLWRTAWRLLLLQRSNQHKHKLPQQQQQQQQQEQEQAHVQQEPDDTLLRQQRRQAKRQVKQQQQQQQQQQQHEDASVSRLQPEKLDITQQQQPPQQHPQHKRGTYAAAGGLAQQGHHQQMEQLVRLGLSSHAPRRSIYDKLHKLKPARLPTRKCLQYENCRILSPDGTGLATCGLKKVKWYLERDLAELVSENPAVIRLKFTPKGSGHADDAYYLSDKENQCVVCGHTGDYLRHSIVPHCYRSHFPAHMKSHLSHDIVLMCPGCHQIANMVAQARMQELGMRYGAPLDDASKRFQTDRQLGAVRSAAKALSGKAATRIPPARVAELQAVILQHSGRENQLWPASLAEQQQLLADAVAVEVKTLAEGWLSHAAIVVVGVVAEGERQQQQQQAGPRVSKQKHVQPAPAAADRQGTKPSVVQQLVNGNISSLVPAAALVLPMGAGAAAATAATAALAGPVAEVGLSLAWAALLGDMQDPKVTPHSSPAAGTTGLEAAPMNAAGTAAAAAAAAATADGSSTGFAAHLGSQVAAAVRYGFNTAMLAIAAATATAAAVNQAVTNVTSSSSSSSSSSCGSAGGSATLALQAPVRLQNGCSLDQRQTAATTADHGDGQDKLVLAQQPCTLSPSARLAAAEAAKEAAVDRFDYSAAGEAALEEFVRGWRRHFLQTMQPKFLPPFWSVDSRVRNSSGLP